jgi:hypothetical protein
MTLTASDISTMSWFTAMRLILEGITAGSPSCLRNRPLGPDASLPRYYQVAMRQPSFDRLFSAFAHMLRGSSWPELHEPLGIQAPMGPFCDERYLCCDPTFLKMLDTYRFTVSMNE